MRRTVVRQRFQTGKSTHSSRIRVSIGYESAGTAVCYDGARRRDLVAVLLLLSSPALAQIEGRARAVSGNLLDLGGRPWTCGLRAAFALAGLVERHWLTCVARGRDEAGRVTAVCRMGGPAGVEVNALMVA